MRRHHAPRPSTKARQGDAEVLSRLVRLETVLPTLATKADVLSVRADFQLAHAELKSEFQECQAKLRSELQQSQAELRSELQQSQAELRSAFQQSQAELRSEFQVSQAELKTELKADVLSLRGDMAVFEARLLRWLIGMGIAGLAMIFSFMNFQMSRIEGMLQRHMLTMPSVAASGAEPKPRAGFP